VLDLVIYLVAVDGRVSCEGGYGGCGDVEAFERIYERLLEAGGLVVVLLV
jgi:hypothetical protein